MNKFLLLLVVVFILSTNVYAHDDIELVVVRSKHELAVKQNGNTLRTFKVAFGSGGRKVKLQLGDHITPKGQYYISKMRDSNHFHLFFQLNYPNLEDAKRGLQSHRGNMHMQVFDDDDDYEFFLKLLKTGSTRENIELHAYCLMPTAQDWQYGSLAESL